MTSTQITSTIRDATGIDVSDGPNRIDLNKLHLAAVELQRRNQWFAEAWADALGTFYSLLLSDPWDKAEAMAKAIVEMQHQ